MRNILVVSFLLCLVATLTSAQDKAKVIEYRYNTKLFSMGGQIRQLTIKTGDGRSIASMLVPEKMYLSIYSDKQKTLPQHQTEFSGMISIRIKSNSDVKHAGSGEELMAGDSANLEFPDAVVTLTIIEE